MYLYHSDGEWGESLNVKAFEWGMIVFHTQHFPVCIKNGTPFKGHTANLT